MSLLPVNSKLAPGFWIRNYESDKILCDGVARSGESGFVTLMTDSEKEGLALSKNIGGYECFAKESGCAMSRWEKGFVTCVY